MPKAVNVEALEDRFALFMRTHRRTMHRYFQSIGLFNGHPIMLFRIRQRPGLTQKELAEEMEISAASVAISVKRMEAAGLIERRRDETDARIIHLYLTPEGQKMDAACGKGRDFMIRTMYRDLTDEEKQTLYSLLEKMTDNLQSACDTFDREAAKG